MNLRWKIFATLAVGHLLLAAASAAHLPGLYRLPLIAPALAWYGDVSGAGATFAFFAPKVAPRMKATFLLTDDQGHSWTSGDRQGQTSEANLRFAGTISMFAYPQWGEQIAASWAASMFGQYPRACSVEVRVDVEDLPTMEQYRAGFRPRWQLLYQRTFQRADVDSDPSASQAGQSMSQPRSPSPTHN